MIRWTTVRRVWWSSKGDAVLSLPGAGTEPTALLMKTCVCDPLAVRERGWRMGLQL